MMKPLIGCLVVMGVGAGTAIATPLPQDLDGPVSATTSGRPEGLAFGIGVGYQFATTLRSSPASLGTPNVTSVRVRLPSGLTFEPQLRLATLSDRFDDGMATGSLATWTAVGVATTVRMPVITRGRVDFEMMGRIAFSTVHLEPVPSSGEARATEASLGWGVGLSYWLNGHWNVSMSATNPVVAYSKMTPNTSTRTLGLVFDPEVALMIHLFN